MVYLFKAEFNNIKQLYFNRNEKAAIFSYHCSEDFLAQVREHLVVSSANKNNKAVFIAVKKVIFHNSKKH